MAQPLATIRNKNKGEQKSQWLAAGTITVAEAALAVDERDNASVEAFASTKTVIYRRRTMNTWAELRVRATGSNNERAVLQMYAASGQNDYYSYMGQLSLVIGQQQADGDNLFVDTFTPASENGFYEAVEWNTTDYIGRYAWKMKGYDRFLIICSAFTDAGVTALACDIREFNSDFDEVPVF